MTSAWITSFNLVLTKLTAGLSFGCLVRPTSDEDDVFHVSRIRHPLRVLQVGRGVRLLRRSGRLSPSIL